MSPVFTRRRLLHTGAALAGAVALPLQAQVHDLNDAINKAGRQRMLSQRMAKAYLALGMEIEHSAAQQVLEASMVLFERQLAELKAYAPSPTIRATYEALDLAWQAYRAALTDPRASRDQVAALVGLDSRVLALSHQGTSQYESASGKSVGRLVNLCGRQRMLSQRCAKFYLALAWDSGLPQAKAELDKARSEFVAAHAVLSAAPEATPTIRDELELARQQWMFFENALQFGNQAGLGARRASDVFRASENILAAMDRVTGLYARLSA
ncbi:type IV pili methyl-accepting chemotaxis transducer N-terminal domain-containing protein [Ideonella sp. BN130291]|uniref:type IV pili methyl-accepting chemotaxis transducer N-terminal domain-containing protein n=1 Tax=Ideonella sp. BN130291 TaxID=3112940 RepID=UPI002E273131|nr:type IV pili methyl-accepting chemotaxis transducer N-terminal domain-containing protein [Ideonella sp. BN130291]